MRNFSRTQSHGAKDLARSCRPSWTPRRQGWDSRQRSAKNCDVSPAKAQKWRQAVTSAALTVQTTPNVSILRSCSTRGYVQLQLQGQGKRQEQPLPEMLLHGNMHMTQFPPELTSICRLKLLYMRGLADSLFLTAPAYIFAPILVYRVYL